MGIKYTRVNKVKGSNLTRIRGGRKNFRRVLGGGEKKKFFSPNLINELKIIKQSPIEIKLVATGIDDVVWTYSIIKSK